MRIFFVIAHDENEAEKNRNYVGESPCSVIVKIDSHGRFANPISSFAHPVAVFMADAPASQTNLFSQSQILKVPAIAWRTDKAPDAIFFDMHKQSQ